MCGVVLVNRMFLQFASAELKTDRACMLGVCLLGAEGLGKFDGTGVSCPCICTSRLWATSTGSRELGYNAFKARVASSEQHMLAAFQTMLSRREMSFETRPSAYSAVQSFLRRFV